MDVDLFSRGGTKVGTYTLPPLIPQPDVILKGPKVYHLSRLEEQPPGNPVYRECEAWVIEHEGEGER